MNIEQIKIVNYPHPALRHKAIPVEKITDQVIAVAHKMLELMHEAPGVGLAAPQIALPWQLFVANPTGDPDDNHIYINPTLTDPSAETDSYEEGCLSLPGITCQIIRPIAITITATDLQSQSFTDQSDQLIARIWQHEFDHLQGTLIIDKMNKMDQLANRRAIKELEEK